MSLFPVELSRVSSSLLGVKWNDGHVSTYEVRNLRLACPCAECVDEWTHEKLIQEDKIPGDVKPKRITTVGRYALRFDWSDGHRNGIYRFQVLRSLCDCPACKKE